MMRPAGLLKRPSAVLTRTRGLKVVLTQAALVEQVLEEVLTQGVPTTPTEQDKEVVGGIAGEWGQFAVRSW